MNDVFMSTFKRLIHGSSTSRLSLNVVPFLVGKGSFEVKEDFTVIRLYCSHEKPSYMTYYVSDKIFIIEICTKYKFWTHLFNEKSKK
jgi:hypothetical protein